MCGLAGVLIPSNDSLTNLDLVGRMCIQMRSRGPDAYGYWSDPTSGVSLGHRRLSIIDLDTRANQPMISEDGRFIIVFNGEIYNFRELRTFLANTGEVFRTQSDTEVVLKLYSREAEAMLSRLRGMFALAIWDVEQHSLFLARDPYGIKPLYVAHSKQGWLFASQVKALLATGLIDLEPDALGQAGFWMFGSVPEPHTWYKHISAFPSGCWSRLYRKDQQDGPYSYWDVANSWRDAPNCNHTISQAEEVVRSAVAESVSNHLVSDVPVGVFLSGGIDSCSVAGLIRDCGTTSIQGVTVAFQEFEGKHEDEVPAAREIARLYGIQHHVRRVSRNEFQEDLPKILSAMDQPSIDGINTWYASKAVSELGLKVAISGVGGDELFYGYPSFKQLPALVSSWQKLEYIPGIRSLIDLAMRNWAERIGNPRLRWLTSQANNFYGAYWLRRGLFAPDALPALMGTELFREASCDINPTSLVKSLSGSLPKDPMAIVGQLESMIYLRNQLLRDSDWASMAHSVELRTPLVDAWLLRDLMPIICGFGRLKGKTLLAGSPTVPLSEKIMNRAKTGFGIPLGQWCLENNLAGISPNKVGINRGGGVSRWWAKVVADKVYKK